MSKIGKDNTTLKRGPMMMGRIPEKPKNFKQSLMKIFSFIKPYYYLIIISIILSIFSTALTLALPKQLEKMTNEIQKGLFFGINFDSINKIGILLIIIVTVGAVFSYIQGYIMSGVSQRTSKTLRSKLSEKINKLPLSYLDSRSQGDILSRVTNDVDTLGNTLNNSITAIISSIVLLIGSLIMMFITNWLLALCAIAASFVGMILITVIMKHSQKYFIQQQSVLGELNGHISEVYTHHNIVKAYNAEKQSLQKFSLSNTKLFTSAWKSQFLSGLMFPLMGFIGNLGYVVVCVVGADLVYNNVIDFGVIVSFLLYIRFFTQPLAQLAQAMTTIQSTVAAGERVFEFLEEKELENEEGKLTSLSQIEGNVTFKNVKFGYLPNKEIIHNFNLEIKAGQKVAIVGPTGAGKTTIVNLLMRFYETNAGEIFIDNHSIKDLSRESVHNMFGMVLQDSWLFAGSIKENIVYNQIKITDAEVEEACKLAGIDHFIKTLPDGYNTKLDEKTALSAGQKQLLTIARAMVQNNPMLILDEATSSVDTRTEILIQKAMDRLMKGRTSFVIAHRLSTIKNADIILVMKDGNIVEVGNHKDLLEQDGEYANLYNSQFENI